MASNRDFSFIYQDASTDILCGPLQQLEDPAVLMLLQPHEQQQQQQHTMDSDVSQLHYDNSSGSSPSFLSPSHPLNTNDDNEKRTTPTVTTTHNGEISPETCWDSPSSETGGLTTTSINNTTTPESNSSSNNATSRRRSRTSPLSNPARRAEHNATERARRESLNGKFRLLASILPNLQNSKKPSKSQIIEKALEWVEHSLLSEERYQFELLRLEQENKRINDQLQQCLVSSQQHQSLQQSWPLHQTPPHDNGIHSNNNNNNYCYTAVPSPPSSTTTSVSSSNYSCGSNNSHTNVTPIMVTPSSTSVDVSLISQHQQQQYHHPPHQHQHPNHPHHSAS
ncbi:hypothetical protein BDA99DRAFT_533778 [Phascolomyces articulosus]|uniref:BHLH domain-containing protein n=1 Tax=Phascolomyces articulosus TaxID=60185 RepID=A0AAD5PI44_9FUNG|nr:hypothetical protein BDA99DRAFT_533778 [Phascolomyces articulosus]